MLPNTPLCDKIDITVGTEIVSAALLLRLNEGGVDLVLVQKPWVVGGKVAGLGTKEYKLMLDPKEG